MGFYSSSGMDDYAPQVYVSMGSPRLGSSHGFDGRRHRVYSSSLSTWRRQRDEAELQALAPNKRGPKVPANRAEVQQIAKLTGEVGRLKGELEKDVLVIGVQKKIATLLGRPIDDETGVSRSGAMPEPTVAVRMREIAKDTAIVRERVRGHVVARPDSGSPFEQGIS